MDEGRKIDVAALKRDIVACTGAGKKFSRRALSLAATGGKNVDLVRDILSRGRDRQLTLATVSGLADAMGQPLSRYIATGIMKPGKERISVVGVVQAGVWTERPEWPMEDRYEIEVEPATLPGERFGLEMAGNSMDRTIPPGFILECIRVFGDGGPTPQSGDIVIVRRTRNDLTETTCKRLEILPDGTNILHCESYRSEFSDPVFIGKPNADDVTDDEYQIIAVVEGARQNFLRNRRS